MKYSGGITQPAQVHSVTLPMNIQQVEHTQQESQSLTLLLCLLKEHFTSRLEQDWDLDIVIYQHQHQWDSFGTLTTTVEFKEQQWHKQAF